jgi:hypothetical protein
VIGSYEIEPGVGVGVVAFGEARSDHRARLGAPVSFERVRGQGIVDGYYDNTLMLTYDSLDALNRIELGGVDVYFRGVQLLDRPLSEVIQELAALGAAPGFAGGQAYELSGFGISLVTPAPDEPEIEVESVEIVRIH